MNSGAESLAVYQASPADLSWLISLSLSLGNLLITNQKASLTLHMRSGTGADRCRQEGGGVGARGGVGPGSEPRSTKRRPVGNSGERLGANRREALSEGRGGGSSSERYAERRSL